MVAYILGMVWSGWNCTQSFSKVMYKCLHKPNQTKTFDWIYKSFGNPIFFLLAYIMLMNTNHPFIIRWIYGTAELHLVTLTKHQEVYLRDRTGSCLIHANKKYINSVTIMVARNFLKLVLATVGWLDTLDKNRKNQIYQTLSHLRNSDKSIRLHLINTLNIVFSYDFNLNHKIVSLILCGEFRRSWFDYKWCWGTFFLPLTFPFSPSFLTVTWCVALFYLLILAQWKGVFPCTPTTQNGCGWGRRRTKLLTCIWPPQRLGLLLFILPWIFFSSSLFFST